MAKRAFIIHGWDSGPDLAWIQWLMRELEAKGFEVSAPTMPDPERPRIETWVSKLADLVKSVDGETCFIGHSIGCQTILRYLETLPEGKKAARVVLVAPWMTLTDKAWETDEDPATAKPWMETPINWSKVRTKAKNFTAIFSTNDPYVPLEENKKIFGDNLGAKIIVEEGKGHFSGSDGVKELPSILLAMPGTYAADPL